MAAVARPSPSDARIPCPQCGGLIHPIAGRCKHCKIDLSAQRGARPAAAAALPALAKVGTSEPSPVAAQPRFVDPAIAAAATISVLPPRPDHSLHLPVSSERGWFARHWPMLVIVLAALAIIGAVILMLVPPSDADAASKKAGAPGPASDRMETNPTLPTPDPWSGAAPTPTVPDPMPTPDVDPDPPTPTDPDPDPGAPSSDPFANPFGGIGSMGGNTTLAIMGNVVTRLCDKAKACSDPSIAGMCASVARLYPRTALPANCPAAQKCLEIVDQIDVCGGQTTSGDFPALALSTSACVEAMTQCT